MHSKRLWRSLASFSAVAVSVLSFGTLTPSIVRADSPTLKITEINWAGSAGNAQDEWIELQNVSGSTVTFSSTPYTLEAEIGGVMQTIATLGAGDGSLTAGEFLVLHREALADSTLAGTGSNVDYIQASSLNLPDTATVYQVKQDTTVVDSIDGTAGSLPFAGSATASMSKTSASAISNLSSSWYTARTIGTHFKSGVEQYGTPGTANVDIAAPTHLAISPQYSVNEHTDPVITGTADTDADEVEVTFTQTSFSPSPLVRTYTGSVDGSGNFTVTAGSPDLEPGRYTVTVQAIDTAGNMSALVTMPGVAGSTETDYLVVPTSSSVPAPSLDSFTTVTNQGTVTISGTLDTTGHAYDSIEVTRNGMYLGTIDLTDDTFSIDLPLLQNMTNTFRFYAVTDNGKMSEAAEAMVVHDSLAPAAVVGANVHVIANPSGNNDSLSGLAGAAEPGTNVYVYTDASLTQLLAVVPVNADGSFGSVNLGDNLYTKLYLVVVDSAGNRSQVTVIENPTGYLGGSVSGINPTQASSTGTESIITWSPVTGAAGYLLKYKPVGGVFGAPLVLCQGGNSSCTFSIRLTDLLPNTDYVLAMAALDSLGNASEYVERTVRTGSVPAAQVKTTAFTGIGGEPGTTGSASTSGRVPTRIAQGTDQVTKVEPTPAPSPSPTAETGEVKSSTDTNPTRNWTPWIILGVLLGIAILATAGYFYWFGGEAGEAAMAGIGAETTREKAAPVKRTTRTTRKTTTKRSPRDKRW